jgi:ABC-type bacteriocin/lantibiotic exporter with double-glycine peptidase domain
MSEEGDTFWVSLAEKFFGIIVIIIGGILLYLTATSTGTLGAFSIFFGVVSVILLAIGLFLLLVRPTE